MLSRQNLRGLLTLASLFVCPLAADAQEDIAKKAKAILETNCYACHGKDGSIDGEDGGINYILDRDHLVQKRKIIPGNGKDSKIYKKMNLDMPPATYADNKPVKQRPSEADIALIKKWIDEGAPDFNPPVQNREFIKPEKMLELMLADLNTFDPRDQKFIRYITLTHLWNAGLTENEMQSYRNAISKLVNSLSWDPDITVPKPIDPPYNSILRIELKKYDWNEKTWDAIAAANPYGIIHDTEEARKLYLQTGCNQPSLRVPHVRGDWFVHTAARPPLYHIILKLPKTDKELETKLGIDVADNIRREMVERAGFDGSGVSINNRLLEWHKTAYGSYWKSYDFAGKLNRKNLFKHPLGPGTDQEFFDHDGGEITFNLPNKLQAYMLIDAKGNRIDKVDRTDLVSDKKQNDKKVVNGISCMSCHAKGMLEKDDQVREAVLKSNAYTAQEVALVKRLYPPKADFDKRIQKAAKDFREALEKAEVKLSDTEPIVALSKRFEDAVDLKLAAAELGVQPEKLKQVLANDKLSDSIRKALSPLGDSNSVPREEFVQDFGELVRVMNLGKFQPPVLLELADLARGKPKPGEERAFEIGELNGKKIPMVFCWVPSGKAKLGSPATEKDRSSDETEHEFQTEGFWLAKYPVTQEQWEAVMKSNPSTFDGKKDNKAKGLDASRFPVENVSWEDCQKYMTKLNDRGGVAGVFGDLGKFTLPHEDEWEYACRGGKVNKSPFYWGDELNGILANCDGKHPYGTATEGPYLQRTTKVGSYETKAPHPWGLCDMSGNVYQWCENKYDANGSIRVIRGGSWDDDARLCRSAYRYGSSAVYRSFYLGFRVALVPSGQ